MDDYDLCIDNSENGINPVWGVDFYGCAIVNNPPMVEFVTGPYHNQLIKDDFLFSYRLSDIDGDDVVAQAKIILLEILFYIHVKRRRERIFCIPA